MSAGQAIPDEIHQTYRYLRVLLLFPATWLLAAIVVISVSQGSLLDSISDYYGSPLRDVFVGGLMASGICMIAYKGDSKLEEYVLNFAGVNAFVVALVPNSFQKLLDDALAAEGSGNTLLPSDSLVLNLELTVGCFLALVLVFLVLDWGVFRWTRFRPEEQTRPANVLIGVSWIAELVLAYIVVRMVSGHRTFAGHSIYSVIHFSAAAVLVVSLGFAAASHAIPAQLRMPGEARPTTLSQKRRALGFYGFITIGMGAGLLVGGPAIVMGLPRAILFTEFWEVLLFIVFWVGATVASWQTATPER